MKISKKELEEIVTEELNTFTNEATGTSSTPGPIQPQKTAVIPKDAPNIEDLKIIEEYVDAWEILGNSLQKIATDLQGFSGTIAQYYKDISSSKTKLDPITSWLRDYHPEFEKILNFDALREPIVLLGMLSKTISQFAPAVQKTLQAVQRYKNLEAEKEKYYSSKRKPQVP